MLIKNNPFRFPHSVIQDPSSQRLHWISPPNNILIIRKPGPQTMSEFRQLIIKLLKVSNRKIEFLRFSLLTHISESLGGSGLDHVPLKPGIRTERDRL